MSCAILPRILSLCGLAVVLAGATGCSDPGVPTKHRLCIVLDPTVEDAQQVTSNIAAVADRVQEDGELAVWYLDEQMVVRQAPRVFTYPFDARAKTGAAHATRVSNDLRAIASDFDAAWERAHRGAANQRPNSCLLTALFQIANYVHERRSDGRATDVVVISNLLEVCADWGGCVNLERSLSATTSLVPESAKQAINLGGIQGLEFLRTADSHVPRPTEVVRLRALWTQAARELGFPREPTFVERAGRAAARTPAN